MKKFKFFVFVAALMTAVACSEPLTEVAEEVDSNTSEVATDATTKSHWGNKEPIPYTISNMKLALAKLQSDGLSKSVLSDVAIKPTHVYLKFFPSDLDELDILKADEALSVVPVPYDCDLEGFDGNYHDPEVPADRPTYHYSVVEVGHPLPNVRYQVLDSLYMPDLVEDMSLSKSHSNALSIWPELECEAIRLSGFDTTYTIDENITLSKGYKPGGTVCSYDNVIENYEQKEQNRLFGVPNVRIHVNFSTHRKNGYTDKEGEFKTDGTFRNKVHTHVYFENSDYQIYEDKSNDVAAYYYGRVKSRNMPIQFKKDNVKKVMCSAVARAAYWSFNVRHGLTQPKCKTIRVFVNGHIDTPTQGEYNNGNSIVSVYAQGMTTQNVAGAVIAQLAKSMLCNASGVSAYNASSLELKESWGVGISNILTEDLYNSYLSPLLDATNYTFIFPYKSSTYTHVVSDVYEQISVFSLETMEQCVRTSKTLQDLCNNLKRKNGSVARKLEDLFNYWKNY